MTFEVRGAEVADYPQIRETLVDAFRNTDDEVDIWDRLVSHDRSMTPQCARIVVVDGQAVATTIVLPRSIRARDGWVAGAEITLVACRTSLQGRGYGSAVFRDALSFMKDKGMALGIFYGEPGYYPRFGCAPVLARRRGVLPVKTYRDQGRAWGRVGVPARMTLAPALPEDTPTLLGLFLKNNGVYPGAVSRTSEAWEWQPRDPSRWQLWVLPDRSAYAVASLESQPDALYIDEAGATNPASAHRLLNGLVGLAEERGKDNLRIALPATHPLGRAMAAYGHESVISPASAGFAVIVDWTALLPGGYSRTEDGLAFRGQTVLRAGTIPLTQLVMGYKDVDDLMYLPGVALGDKHDSSAPTDSEEAAALLRRDFPRLTPAYMYAPFYKLR